MPAHHSLRREAGVTFCQRTYGPIDLPVEGDDQAHIGEALTLAHEGDVFTITAVLEQY
ncbi:uncharacterized protein METZ01_LOCUS191618 [marine metagenome]|uniref:Uncharacterized protein n=1 Tax=marine metagenome TaxID=408172 RepID=A0A382DL80_9ZZZZ